MTQLPLPLLPAWWTAEDSRVCDSYFAQEARDDMPHAGKDIDALTDLESSQVGAWCDSLHPDVNLYTCRRCCNWRSNDGIKGDCLHDNVMAAVTRAGNCCEEWYPAKAGVP